ncbi:hypothetical protein QWY22_16525 [Planococcus liqunii]|uniref:hypothetical protein n=1 Tax=Planococcus liqunii TaxID=3058394 RepID=UPI002607874D|nr:hypothetical protein [Planococcus sp. N056]WKA50487.1 hypothetical protein QWY22_16525 [Planococcus sp. N056]
MEVYMVFTDTKTPLSKMIKLYTRHPYSHVSLSFNRELNEVYSFGRKSANKAFSGGFVKEDLHGALFQRAHCAIFKCQVSEEGYAAMRVFIHKMEQRHEQYKYNLAGLFAIALQKAFEREKAFFCSQFVSEVLQYGGIQVSTKPSSLTMPSDLFDAEQFDLLYRGAMEDYPFFEKVHLSLQEEKCLAEVL